MFTLLHIPMVMLTMPGEQVLEKGLKCVLTMAQNPVWKNSTNMFMLGTMTNCVYGIVWVKIASTDLKR